MRGLRLAALSSLLASTISPLAAQPGEWPMPRCDRALTGRQELPGRVVHPALSWSLFVGGMEALVEVKPAKGQNASKQLLPDEPGRSPAEVRQAFGLGAPLYDLAGDGKLTAIPEQPEVKIAKVLPELPGLQRVEFDSAFGSKPECRGRLIAYDEGLDRPRVVWETPPEDDMYMPLVLVGHFAGGSSEDSPEIAVATHYRVMLFEGRTGRKIDECRFHGFRNYGFFGAEDIDRDGRAEFIIVADFISHLDVIDQHEPNAEGHVLSVLWRRDIEPTIADKKKITRSGPDPILDLDGDGRFEVVINLFSDTGDGEWHITAFDALTGGVALDLPRRYMAGAADADGDGRPELFCVETTSTPLPVFGRLELISWRDRELRTLLDSPSGAWQTWDVPQLPLNRNTGAALGRRTVLTGDGDAAGRPEVFVAALGQRPGYHSLAALSVGATGALDRAWHVSGPRPTLLAVGPPGSRAEGRALVAFRSMPGEKDSLGADDAEVRVDAVTRLAGSDTIPLVARLGPDGGGPPRVVAQTPNEGVVYIEGPAKGQAEPAIVGRVPGRGMTDSTNPTYGVLAADVNGDGQKELLTADCADDGVARIVCRGRREWTRTFPHIDGRPPVWNFGGLTYWTVCNLGDGRTGVCVSVRRSTMHSDETYMLDGRDGSEIWHQTSVPIPGATEGRGYGGKMMAAADLDGDGRDELICEYPDLFFVADSLTGEVRTLIHAADARYFGGWTAYAVPVVADFVSGNGPEALWGSCNYVTGMLTPRAEVLWHTQYTDAHGVQGSSLQGVGDVDGDGCLEVVGLAGADTLVCYDGASGAEEWRLQVPGAVAGSIATGDINGDGLDEAVLAAGVHLVAVNAPDGKAQIAWSLALPAAPYSPIIADTDDDGSSEVLTVCRDGELRVVDEAR